VVVKRATTIREIAAAAGVSAMTVSLALRGSREVSAATRKRIRALAESMGYRPNPMVSALMQQVAGGAREQAQELGFGLLCSQDLEIKL
jgi:LacI family transcriptional regulator